MEINWAVNEVIRPAIDAAWNDTSVWGWKLDHAVGVDTGEALLVRTGVRGDNDLASIGTAPNVAAKLSELRGLPSIFITKQVFDDLNEHLLFGPNGERMWTTHLTAFNVGGTNYMVYGSTWWWGH